MKKLEDQEDQKVEINTSANYVHVESTRPLVVWPNCPRCAGTVYAMSTQLEHTFIAWVVCHECSYRGPVAEDAPSSIKDIKATRRDIESRALELHTEFVAALKAFDRLAVVQDLLDSWD